MSNSDTKLGWHFTYGYRLRDGRPLPAVGEVLRHDGPLVPCKSGLHFSERAIDALRYAPGAMAHRVRGGGEMRPHDGDKWCARERTILWSVDAEALLGEFSRRCALDVVHLWNAPPVVLAFLRTGDKTLRTAAWAAARAAWAAAGAATWAARAAWAATEAATWATRATWAIQNARLEGMLMLAHGDPS